MSNRPRKYQKKFRWFRFFTIMLAVLVGFEFVLGGVALFALNEWMKDSPVVSIDDFFTQESSLIFDAEGNQIADVGLQLRENVSYEQIPEAMIDAFLAIEDSRYFTHNGFDVPRFTKSIFETILHGNVQGGSTFTMQLVKLTYFVNDENGTSRTKDIQYKVQQIALALQLEKQSTKKDIFTMYLNKMNFGGVGNIRGVQKAAQQYFDKNVWELNLSECALLAGVINSPYYYDPHNYLDHATERRNEVLYQMMYHGYIDENAYRLAKSVKVEDLLVDTTSKKDDSKGFKYQAYIDEAIKEAERVTGQDPYSVSMEIYTCMDPKIQEAVEDIQAGEVDSIQFFDDKVENAIITENNQTGEIIAIGGGRNYAHGGSMLLNHATDQYNQPGSTMKPILEYVLAFEYLGWATSHVVVDKPVASGNWIFTNAGTNSYRGQMKLELAVGISLNTPAIQALNDVIDEIGVEKVKDYLEDLGFSRFNRDQFDIQYAVGASSLSVSAKELMAAHAIMMNGGNYIEPHTIKKIVYRNSTKEPPALKFRKQQVVSPQAAYLMSKILATNVSVNWGNLMYLLNRGYTVYAKTGTTDYGDSGVEYGIPVGEAKDTWMVAETTNYTTVSWTGYEKAEEPEDGVYTYMSMDKILANTNGLVNSYLLDLLNEDNYPEPVERPDGISTISHILAIFPYVAPIEGMPSEYIATGEIKTEYAKLEAPEEKKSLESISSFNAAIDKDYKITMDWGKYPDEDALKEAKTDDLDISLKDANGNVIRGATGTRLFDYSWVWGRVVYKARISQNGQTIREITSEDEKTENTEMKDELAENTETQVCGFYGYSKDSATSNEICTTITTPEKQLTAPLSTATLEEIAAWKTQYKLNIKQTEVTDAEKAGTFDLRQAGKSVFGQIIDRHAELELIVYKATGPLDDKD